MASQNVPKMSLVAQYDDLCRYTKTLMTVDDVEKFKIFVENQRNLNQRRKNYEAEIQELKNKINSLEVEKNKYELQIKHMKDLVAREIEKRRRLEDKKSSMERQIALIKEVLMADGNAIDNQTKEKLFFLSTTTYKAQEDDSQNRLTTIEESIGSLLSPSDIDDTDEDLNPNVSRRRKRRSKGGRRSSGDRTQKKKKSGENVAFQFDETEEDVRMEIDKMPEKKATEFRSSSEPNSTTPVESIRQVHRSDSGQTKSCTYDLRIHNTGTLPSSTPHGRYSTGGKLSRTHALSLKLL
ncbi:Rac GTPase-activating protein 1 like protein [Argiope bruennichi]|uniref:Rac GTPase-activating protein 1 like protein n=1 Tax=Argiope bruennichi TaxID=94029 RepID=A0A8T0G171_ARGBR|nr:Rac GTPase-activating protein 1 like protein [Argiope bruennichi]